MERYSTNDIKPSNRAVRNILEGSWVANALLKAFAVFGVSLIMADGILTPAQSVLGAIQGKSYANEPCFREYHGQGMTIDAAQAWR